MKVPPQYATHLRKGLVDYFKLDELASLCRDLGIDFENIGGEGKEGKARELVDYCQRRGLVSEFLQRCAELRPQFPWHDPDAPVPTPFSTATPFNLENSIVAVLDAGGKIAGTGFVVAGPLIITCAHVVLKLGEVVTVRPHTQPHSFPTDLIALSSRQPKAPGEKDVAVLRPRAPLPVSLTPLTLAPGPTSPDRPFITLGYPPAGTIQGVRAKGEIRGRVRDEAGLPFLQLDSKEVANGMSGAPVVDAASQHVVGMVSHGFNLREAAKLRDVAWAVPTEIIQEFLPAPSAPLRRENPFYVSGRINDPSLFFGRERERREIQAELRKHSSVSLVGPSQIGKSSLLYTLHQTAPTWLRRGRTLYLDLQGVLDEADFCAEILHRLGREGDSLRQLKNALSQDDLLLFLDETERLAESDFNPRLHDLLRSLTQEPHFALCLASQRPLVELFPSHTPGGLSPFYNIFVEKPLGPFSEAEARAFLARQLAGTVVQFTPLEIESLLRESRGHPAHLQRLAKALFDRYVA